MNRERDFHKKADGVIVNMNTKDYHRARKRNRIMQAANTALGDDGTLVKVAESVENFTNQPSRAEKRVDALEKELAETKALNEQIVQQLNVTNEENQQIRSDLSEALIQNQQIKEQVQDIVNTNTELLKLTQRLDELENK